MKYSIILILLFAHLLAFANIQKDKTPKYKATVWAFPYGKVEGNIYVHLFGENKGKTTIELVNETEKSDLSYSKRVEKIEVITAAIKLILIDSVLYKFINFRTSPSKTISNYCVAIKSETDDKYQLLATDTTRYLIQNIYMDDNGESKPLNNCCLKKIYGKDSFAIYQFGLEWDEQFAVIALPKTALYSKFMLVSSGYFIRQRVWRRIQFRSCTTIIKNIDEGKEGWILNEQNSQSDKIEIWKRYIDAWEACNR